MSAIQKLLTDHIDIWTAADTEKKSGRGRSSGNAGSVYGIKKLRELILELAVRGKLVPQDPNDEPASELLKRISDEKNRLIAKGEVKRGKSLPSSSEEVNPFEIPNGWAYSQLGDVVEIVRGITFPGSEKTKVPDVGRVACLRTTNVQDQVEWDDILYIREEFVSREDQILKPRDIVMSMANSRELVGKVALVGESIERRTSFGGFLAVLRPFIIEPSFLMAFLRTPQTRAELIDSASQTTNIANISLAKLRPLFFPIPPLREQHRIVAKVDELMALCDQLETQHINAADAHEKLVSHLLGTLTESQSAADFSDNWQRIAVHFDTLFTTEASIDALKQTLLQLAVMGKLVPQDPNDEPASELLKRIQAEKAKLVAEGKIKKDKPLPPITDEEKPFNNPQGWEWVQFINIALEYSVGIDRGKSQQSVNKQYRYFKMNNILNTGGFQLDDIVSVDATEEEVSRYSLSSGDLLFNTRNSQELVGKTCIYEHDRGEAVLYNNNILRAKFSDTKISIFVDIWMRSSGGKAVLDNLKSGTTNVWAIYQGKLETLPCPLPPLNEQQRIIEKIYEITARCEQLKERLRSSSKVLCQLAGNIVEKCIAECNM